MVFVFAPQVSGDWVVLKSGDRLDGEIVSVSEKQIVIRVNGIEMTLGADDVKEWKRTPTAAEEPKPAEKPKDEPAKEPEPAEEAPDPAGTAKTPPTAGMSAEEKDKHEAAKKEMALWRQIEEILKKLSLRREEKTIAPDADGKEGTVIWDAPGTILGVAQDLQALGPGVAPLLIEQLRGTTDRVMQEKVLSVMHRMGVRIPAKDLLGYLKGDHRHLRLLAIDFLAQGPGREAVVPLARLLKHRDSQTRRKASQALLLFARKPKNRPLILAQLEGLLAPGVVLGSEVRANVVRLVGLVGGKGAVKRLKRELQMGPPGAKIEAIRALGRLAAPGARAELEVALRRHPDTGVRKWAAHSLGRLRDRKSAPALIDALDDRDEKVQKMAAQALRHVTGRRFGPDPRLWKLWWAQEGRKIFQPE